MKVSFDMPGYTNLFTNTVAIPDHNRLVVKKVFPLKLMQWYVTSVIRGSLYKKFGNKCVKILKFWRTELSYAQSKNRDKKMRLLGMDICSSLNDIMEIRCNKCTRSEQGYDF